ncbi:unnamed protein product [Vitrella brassicaformis CCMP3155]|uniref:Phosphoglycerate mutase n=1 Tax=Vitrella brassicaformis (strain CCMP3155) TaxID=1169540 RepID=A0A0G4GGU6_VITBC|nr:unnamed protein product [Vitrella brassicaformis CCMP3155]|eukprot:CEM28676.1 unnamed protein product [Vitrella brassicaformis CCMP3155]
MLASWALLSDRKPPEDSLEIVRERETARPLSDDEMRVYLIRHGQSEYNKWRRESFTKLRWRDMITYDPEIYDAPLTERARDQIRNLSQVLNASLEAGRLEIDAIYSSPLSRSIDTAAMAFEGSDKPLLLHPLLREKCETTGDIGLPRSELQRRHPHWDFTHFHEHDEEWWHKGDPSAPLAFFRKIPHEPSTLLHERTERWANFLSGRSEKSICVVGHSMFFKRWTRSSKMRNLEVRAFIFNKATRILS